MPRKQRFHPVSIDTSPSVIELEEPHAQGGDEQVGEGGAHHGDAGENPEVGVGTKAREDEDPAPPGDDDGGEDDRPPGAHQGAPHRPGPVAVDAVLRLVAREVVDRVVHGDAQGDAGEHDGGDVQGDAEPAPSCRG